MSIKEIKAADFNERKIVISCRSYAKACFECELPLIPHSASGLFLLRFLDF
jgi:hypothetical protein